MQKTDKRKKQYEKDQQTIKSSDNFYRKSLHENVFELIENESLCNVLY